MASSKDYPKFEDYPNVDEHNDNEATDERSAIIRWVQVANSTEHRMKVRNFIERAKRQDAQGGTLKYLYYVFQCQV